MAANEKSNFRIHGWLATTHDQRKATIKVQKSSILQWYDIRIYKVYGFCIQVPSSCIWQLVSLRTCISLSNSTSWRSIHGLAYNSSDAGRCDAVPWGFDEIVMHPWFYVQRSFWPYSIVLKCLSWFSSCLWAITLDLLQDKTQENITTIRALLRGIEGFPANTIGSRNIITGYYWYSQLHTRFGPFSVQRPPWPQKKLKLSERPGSNHDSAKHTLFEQWLIKVCWSNTQHLLGNKSGLCLKISYTSKFKSGWSWCSSIFPIKFAIKG